MLPPQPKRAQVPFWLKLLLPRLRVTIRLRHPHDLRGSRLNNNNKGRLALRRLQQVPIPLVVKHLNNNLDSSKRSVVMMQ